MHGSVSFPGIKQIASGSYTLTHGISPGRAVLAIAPQRGIPVKKGALTFSFGNEKVSLPDFVVDEASEVRAPNGWVTQVTLVDKRRKWGWGAVSGRYNVRSRRTGRIIPGSVKTPPQLAALCLEAMGERGYDVAAMPKEPRPETDWDYTTPAVALTELCADVGCRVTMQTDGKVKIVRLGEGKPLPKGSRAADSRSENPHEAPSALIVVGAPWLIQADFVLEAVGLEADGTVKLIDQLSYRPLAGWTQTPAEEFASETDDKKKEAYKQSVYRMYRVKVSPRSGHGKLPGYGQLVSLEQILPLTGRQVDTTVDADGAIVAAPAEVWGVWYDGQEMTPNTETALRTHAKTTKESFYKRGFSIDRERGIVIFSQPVYKQTTSAGVAAAELCLRVAVNVRDPKTRSLHRYEQGHNLGGNDNTPPRYIYRPELVYAVTGTFNKVDPPGIGKLFTNEAQIRPLAQKFLDREQNILAKLAIGESAVFPGIKKIEPDGFVQAVSWSVGAESPTLTRVEANIDPSDIPAVDLGLVEQEHNHGIAYVEWERWRHLNQAIGQVAGAP